MERMDPAVCEKGRSSRTAAFRGESGERYEVGAKEDGVNQPVLGLFHLCPYGWRSRGRADQAPGGSFHEGGRSRSGGDLLRSRRRRNRWSLWQLPTARAIQNDYESAILCGRNRHEDE